VSNNSLIKISPILGPTFNLISFEVLTIFTYGAVVGDVSSIVVIISPVGIKHTFGSTLNCLGIVKHRLSSGL